MQTFRMFRDVPHSLYVVEQRLWDAVRNRPGYPYRIRLVEDLCIEDVPCRAHATIAIRHEGWLFREVVGARLASRYRARIGLCRRVECERDTWIGFDWFPVELGLWRRAVQFTPVEPVELRGMPLAAGREVSIAWGLTGTLGRDHRIGSFTIPRGSTFEEDPDDFRTIHATLAHEVRVGDTTLAPGMRISVDPRGSVTVVR